MKVHISMGKQVTKAHHIYSCKSNHMIVFCFLFDKHMLLGTGRAGPWPGGHSQSPDHPTRTRRGAGREGHQTGSEPVTQGGEAPALSGWFGTGLGTQSFEIWYDDRKWDKTLRKLLYLEMCGFFVGEVKPNQCGNKSWNPPNMRVHSILHRSFP